MSSPEDTTPNPSADGFFKVYEEYAKTLRTWLVAYGIGAPVLLMTNEKIWDVVKKSGEARWVGGCYLIAVGIQIVLAALNKSVNWAMYFGEANVEFKNEPVYRLADWLSRMYLLDLVVDLLSICLFAWATVKAFCVIVP